MSETLSRTKKAVTLRMAQQIEDRIMVHAVRHKHKFTTMAQILMEEGLDARDLLEAARKEREGDHHGN